MKVATRTVGGLLVLVVCVLGAFSARAYWHESKSATEAAPEGGQFVQAGDVQLFVQTAGNKNNPPILLVHGMAAWSETWRPVIDRLAQNGWYVIAVDMPPFGFSERPANGDVWRVAQAARINALIESLAIPRVTIVAHSYGSRGVLEAALRYPERIKGIVLVDPALSGVYGDTTLPSAKTALLINTLVRYPVVASTMTNPLFAKKLLQLFMYKKDAATDAIVTLYQRPGVRKGSTKDLGAWVRGFMLGADTGLSSSAENVKKLKNVQLVWGKEDATTPLWQGEALAKLIPGAKLFIIPGVGHMPHIEDVNGFYSALTKALAALK